MDNTKSKKLKKNILATNIAEAKANMKSGRHLRVPGGRGYGQPHSGAGLHFKKEMSTDETKEYRRRTLHDHEHDHDHHHDMSDPPGGPPHGPNVAPGMSGPPRDPPHGPNVAPGMPPPPPHHGLFGGGDHDRQPHGPGQHPHPHPEPYQYPEPSLMFQAEGDPEVLKATMDMLETPHSANSRDAALALVENIQANCAYDYEQYCASASTDSGFGGMFTVINFPMPDLLGLKKIFPTDDDDAYYYGDQDDAAEPLPCDSPGIPIPFMNIFGGSPILAVDPVDATEPSVDPTDPTDGFVLLPEDSSHSGVSRKARADTDDSADDDGAVDDGGDDGAVVVIDVYEAEEDKYSPDHTGKYAGHFGTQIRSSGSGASFGMSPSGPAHVDSGGPDSHPSMDEQMHRDSVEDAYQGPNTDYYAGGNIGYSSAGNQCMYDHIADLSSNCQQAIQQAANFRHEYWQEEQDYHHNGGAFFFFLLVGLCAIFVYKKRCSKEGKARRKATEETHSVMEAIHSDASLKNMVESAYGKELPPLVREMAKPPSICRILCRAVGLFFAVCLISNTACHITGAILHNMVFTDDNGDLHPPPKPLVIVVLLSVITIEILMFVLIARCGRYLCGRCCCSGGNDNDRSTTSTTTSDASSALSNTMSRLASYVPTMQSNITAATGFMRSGSAPSPSNNGGYAPLSDDDSYYQPANGSAEMMTFTPTQATAHTGVSATLLGAPSAPPQYAPQGAQHAQYYTGVPVQMPPGNSRYAYNA